MTDTPNIDRVLSAVEICDKCNRSFGFAERMFPNVFHKCRMCERNLCSNCWGHKHLFAWKYCADCKPDMDCDQEEQEELD